MSVTTTSGCSRQRSRWPEQVLHVPDRGDPGAVQRDLLVDHQSGTRRSRRCRPRRRTRSGPRSRCCSRASVPGGRVPEQSTVAEKPRPPVGPRPAPRVPSAAQRLVDQAEVEREPAALGGHVGADDRPGAHRPGQHRRGQADRSEAGDQQAVAARDVEPQQRLVGGAEPARDERPVDVRQRVGQRQAGGLLGQQVVGVPAVALPAVRRAGRRRCSRSGSRGGTRSQTPQPLMW